MNSTIKLLALGVKEDSVIEMVFKMVEENVFSDLILPESAESEKFKPFKKEITRRIKGRMIETARFWDKKIPPLYLVQEGKVYQFAATNHATNENTEYEEDVFLYASFEENHKKRLVEKFLNFPEDQIASYVLFNLKRQLVIS